MDGATARPHGPSLALPRLNSTRSISTQLDSVNLDSTRLDSTRLDLSSRRHGRRDSEITWALARRSYEALVELFAGRVALERTELSDEHDHWSVWSMDSMGRVLGEFGEAFTSGQAAGVAGGGLRSAARRIKASTSNSRCAQRAGALGGQHEQRQPEVDQDENMSDNLTPRAEMT